MRDDGSRETTLMLTPDLHATLIEGPAGDWQVRVARQDVVEIAGRGVAMYPAVARRDAQAALNRYLGAPAPAHSLDGPRRPPRRSDDVLRTAELPVFEPMDEIVAKGLK